MTEKDYNPEQKGKKAMRKAEISEKRKDKINAETTKMISTEKKESEKKPEEVKKESEKPKIKKEEAIVNSYNLPISTKKSAAICKFIKNKRIEDAQKELEEVVKGKKAIPMKGEIPHRKGKIMAGRFPKNTAKHFIILLKSLLGNSNANGIEEPIIVEAIANLASRPYGKFGAWRRKKTHIKLVAKEKKPNKK